MTAAQISAIQTALATAASAVKQEYSGDFIVGVCFAPTATVPTAGHFYPDSLAQGFGRFESATLKAIPAGVDPVEIIPLEHSKERQQ